MIVVDTNVIAYLWLQGAQTKHAERLLEKDPDWIAPLLWRSEFRSVLAGYFRRKDISIDRALQLMLEAESHMNGREFSVPSAEVLSLVERSSCSAYDCEFIALAKDIGVPLVTSDKKILSSFPSIAVNLKDFSHS